jgi:hypothetical protein
LFGRIKERLAGVFIGHAEDLRNEVMSILAEISEHSTTESKDASGRRA